MMFHHCCRHSLVRILSMETPAVVPAIRLKPSAFTSDLGRHLGSLSWFTDLSVPFGNALGLRQVTLDCDRTEAHLTVVEEDEHLLTPWTVFRRERPEYRLLGRMLEGAPGVMPMHWWVATEPVRVTT